MQIICRCSLILCLMVKWCSYGGYKLSLEQGRTKKLRRGEANIIWTLLVKSFTKCPKRGGGRRTVAPHPLCTPMYLKKVPLQYKSQPAESSSLCTPITRQSRGNQRSSLHWFKLYLDFYHNFIKIMKQKITCTFIYIFIHIIF